MTIQGTIEEWQEIEPGRWARKDHPEDGVISLREGLSFAAYWAKRSQPERRRVPKSLIISRIIEAGKIADAKAMLEADAALWAKWTAPDQPAIDPAAKDARTFVAALGLDPDVILAPSA